MAEEWGPWVLHDGRGCRCVGQYVQVEFDDGQVAEGVAGNSSAQAIANGFDPLVSWKWALVATENWRFIAARIIRYRIRKPRGMVVVESLLADLPERVDA